MINHYSTNINFEYKNSTEASNGLYVKHIHKDWELYYLIDGKTDFFVDGYNYKLEKGDLLLIKPTMFHFSTPEQNQKYERVVISFNDAFIPQSIQDQLSSLDVYYKNNLLSPHINYLLTELINIIKGNNTKISLISLESTTKLLLIQLIIKNNNNNFATKKIENKTLLKNILDFIDENIMEINNLNSIIQQFYISESWLSHIFKKNLNISPKQYINYKKIIIAQNMIYNGETPTIVYSKLGFTDYSSFFRLYKKITNTSPKEDYVKKNKNK